MNKGLEGGKRGEGWGRVTGSGWRTQQWIGREAWGGRLRERGREGELPRVKDGVIWRGGLA